MKTNLPLTKGFSVIEVLFVLAIMSILLVLSLNGLFVNVQSQKNQRITAQLFHTLQWARTEAIKRNKTINVCGSFDNQHCSSDWSNGYMVFIEHTPIQTLRSEKIEPGLSIHSGNQTVIKYSGDGRCLSRGSITIGSLPKKTQKIVIYDSGRARIQSQ